MTQDASSLWNGRSTRLHMCPSIHPVAYHAVLRKAAWEERPQRTADAAPLQACSDQRAELHKVRFGCIACIAASAAQTPVMHARHTAAFPWCCTHRQQLVLLCRPLPLVVGGGDAAHSIQLLAVVHLQQYSSMIGGLWNGGRQLECSAEC